MYVFTTQIDNMVTGTFFASSDMGWFCEDCPTVVIDERQAKRMIDSPMSDHDEGTHLSVTGIVDLDAIPPEQRHMTLDQIDPLPIVPFEDVPGERSFGQQPKKKRKARKKKRRR